MPLFQLRQELQKRSGRAVSVSVPTLSRRLKRAVMKSYVPIKKPLLTKAQKNMRYEWTKRHHNWSFADWQKVIFSDESMFRSYNNRRTQCVWRRPPEKYEPSCINYSVKHPLGVQVWGAISSKGTSQLKIMNDSLDSKWYQNEIINDVKFQC